MQGETIVAPATPAGRGGVGIVRISGADVPALARALLGDEPPARRAVLRDFRAADGEAIDRGIALYFPAPGSYTGEHVLELHGHGGPVVVDRLVRRALELGARLARPGEFSERAYLNDRLDLAQAEAVADLIDAGSVAAARAAMRSLAGEFSRRVHALEAALIELRVHVEAAIDFPDEDVAADGAAALGARLDAVLAQLAELARGAEQGRLLQEGYTLVIAGRPNAGKSSLLNALAGHDAAIVTPIPGTTRDVLRERMHLDGLPLVVLDTAGLREGADVVEAEGIRRARHEMQRADRILYVVDAADPEAVAALPAELSTLPAGVAVTVVWNKIDLAGAIDLPAGVRICATSGAGLDALRATLRAAAGYVPDAGGTFSARRRHLDALARVTTHGAAARTLLAQRAGAELVAEELRLAQHAFGAITGEFTSDDLLGRIFASFCIGK